MSHVLRTGGPTTGPASPWHPHGPGEAGLGSRRATCPTWHVCVRPRKLLSWAKRITAPLCDVNTPAVGKQPQGGELSRGVTRAPVHLILAPSLKQQEVIKCSQASRHRNKLNGGSERGGANLAGGSWRRAAVEAGLWSQHSPPWCRLGVSLFKLLR